MPINPLERGAAFLAAQRARHLEREIQYERERDSVVLPAAIGRTEFEDADAYGIVHRLESRDFLIRTAVFVLSDGPTLPKAGDRIREVVGGQSFTYEVSAPGGEPPWRYSDPHRTTLRIHTRRISAEEE